MQADLNDGWMKMKTHFHIESAQFATIIGDERIRRFSDMQSFLGKRSELFCRRMTEALVVVSCRTKNLFVGAKNFKRPYKAIYFSFSFCFDLTVKNSKSFLVV